MPDARPLEQRDPPSVGPYTLIGRLAAGGQGIVYLGRAGDGDVVAVKLLHDAWAASTAGRHSLQREVDAARRVAPFCTAQVLDAQLDTDPQYIVSEFVDGPSLGRAVADFGPLTGAVLDRLAISTATALVAIHRAGVVHRDLKPENILLGPDGPRVIDFGIARETAADVTHTQSLRGTPLYMAPEQFDGHPAGPESDVFAWAATMAFAATGRPTFGAPTLAAVMGRVATGNADLDGVPEPLAGLLRSCLCVDPRRRPTAEEVLNALLDRYPATPVVDPVVGSGVVLQPVPSPMPPTPTPTPAFRTGPVPGYPTGSPQPPMPTPRWVGPSSSLPTGGTGQIPPPIPSIPSSIPSSTPRWTPPPAPAPRPPDGRRRQPVAVILGVAALGVLLVVGGLGAAGGFGWFGGTDSGDPPVADPMRSAPSTAAAGAGATPTPTPVDLGTPTSASPTAGTTTPPAVAASPAATSVPPGSGAVGTSRTTSPASTTTRAAATGVPRLFAGTWSGPMRQTNALTPTWTGRVVLTAGATTGRFEARELSCSGTMRLTRRSARTLTFVLRLDPAASSICAPSASMTLTLLSGQRLTARWQDAQAATNSARGILTRR